MSEIPIKNGFDNSFNRIIIQHNAYYVVDPIQTDRRYIGKTQKRHHEWMPIE